MNQVQLVGRLTKDPELKQQGETSWARFTIAVNRNYKNKEGKYDADFIPCVAYRSTAEFIAKYFSKGSMIGATGTIVTGSYKNKDGDKVYTTDVKVENVEFVSSKGDKDNSQKSNDNAPDEFINVPDGIEEELPFN